MEEYTKEEIETAKAARDIAIESDSDEIKALYMSGEIVMWSEMQAENKELKSTIKKVKDSLTYNDDWKKLTTDELRGAVYVIDKARKILEDVK
jgi:hypothetical protein